MEKAEFISVVLVNFINVLYSVFFGKKGVKISKRKLNNCWCILSKVIQKFNLIKNKLILGRSHGKAAVFGTAIPG